MARGEGSYLYNTAGRRYLDCSAGAAAFSIGHDNPEVNAAIASQLAQVGDYLGGRAARRFAGTTLRCLVT
ncbi:MAG: hypothetical protein DME88_09900, partial [Verrucomicrobia bacterium]